MFDFEEKFFADFAFGPKQIEKFIDAAHRDLKIAGQSDIPEVRFQFTYNALIKLGIALIAAYGKKVKSRTGHHIKIIEAVDSIIEGADIYEIANRMRNKRNTDLYDGGVIISDKEAKELREFVEGIFEKSQAILKRKLNRIF